MSDLIHICPYVRYCSTIPAVMEGITFRQAFDCRLFCVLEGTASLISNDKNYRLQYGSVVYIPTAVPYTIEGTVKTIMLNLDLYANAVGTEPKPPKAVGVFNSDDVFDKTKPPSELTHILYVQSFVDIIDRFSDCVALKEDNSPVSAVALSGLVKEIIARLVNRTNASKIRKDDTVARKVMIYIKQNYDKDFSNDELARLFGYHPYHLGRLFKKTYGITIHQAIVNERIRIARHLLSRTNITVENITKTVGFTERVSFYCAFKKKTGMSPNQYREEKNRR